MKSKEGSYQDLEVLEQLTDMISGRSRRGEYIHAAPDLHLTRENVGAKLSYMAIPKSPTIESPYSWYEVHTKNIKTIQVIQTTRSQGSDKSHS